MQTAALQLDESDEIVPCKVHGCLLCTKLTCIFDHPRTVDYLENEDSAFKEDRLPVDSAQCNNILGRVW